MDNPFFYRGPIDDSGAVYGREPLCERAALVLDRATHGAWLELTGPHRIGKTTLLWAIERRLRATRPQWSIGRLSAQAAADAEEFWLRSARTLGGPVVGGRAKPELEDRLHAIGARGGRAVLLIDEIAALAPGVLEQLRGLSEEFPLGLVSAAPARMNAFVAWGGGYTSAPGNNALEIAVEPWHPDVAREFLRARAHVQPFTAEDEDELVAVAGGHPWRLMAAGWHRWEAREGRTADWKAAWRRELDNEPRERGPAASVEYHPAGSDEVRVFVSSPIAGLAAEREAVRKACAAVGLEPVLAEDFGARDGTSRQVCLGELERCQVLLLVMPARYGPDAGRGVSATQEEVETARRLGVPVLVYVDEEAAPSPRQAAWIEALTGSFTEGLFRAGYRAPSELESRATSDLRRLVLRRARWALDRGRR